MDKPTRVLLLEDSPLDARSVHQTLQNSGTPFMLRIVSDKSSFENALKDFAFDVVVSDHVLPDYDAYQALALVRQLGSPMPFIVVTAQGDEQFAASILREGADDYVPKQFLGRLPASIISSLKRMQAEIRLAAGEKKFRALIENSYDIIALSDRELNIVYNSPSLKRVTGWDNERESYLKRLHPDDHIRIIRIMKEVLANPDHPIFSTFRVCHQRGHYIWLEGTITNKLHDRCIEAVVFNLRDVTDQIEAYEDLVQSEAEMRNFARHLTTVQEEERTRIAREIHDELGQQFVAIKMGVANLARTVQDEKIGRVVAEIVKDVDIATQMLRKIATDLRPGILDTLGLVPSIEWLGKEFQKKTGIVCHVKFEVVKEKFEKEVSNCVFRICQESLTNVFKHAQASEVSIHVFEQNSQLNLVVEDNGRGIPDDARKNPFSMGLLGMRERAKSIDALLQIKTGENAGTAIHLKTNLS